MNFRSILLSVSVVAVLGSCKMQQTAGTKSTGACDATAPISSTLNNQKGTIIKDQMSGRFAISVLKEGTIDEVSTYLICNPDADVIKEGKTVTLSGNVRASKQTSNLGGMTYYDLEISKVQ